jgi:hypothetical protein
VRGPHDGRELECRGGGEGGERERERERARSKTFQDGRAFFGESSGIGCRVRVGVSLKIQLFVIFMSFCKI